MLSVVFVLQLMYDTQVPNCSRIDMFVKKLKTFLKKKKSEFVHGASSLVEDFSQQALVILGELQQILLRRFFGEISSQTLDQLSCCERGYASITHQNPALPFCAM